MFIINWLVAFGKYIEMLGRVFQRPERLRIFFKRYYNEVYQLGIDSIGIVLLISLFIGAVICIQFKMNIQSTWMPSWVPGYATREIMLLEFSSSIMCLILSGKVGSNIASELGAMRVTGQLPDTAQNRCFGFHYASTCYLQRSSGYYRCLLYRLHRTYWNRSRTDSRYAILFQPMVLLDGRHQGYVFCFLDCNHLLVLRL